MRPAKFELLGDQGLLASFPAEADAFAFAAAVRAARLPWIVDVVSAYFTVACFIDWERIAPSEAEDILRSLPTATRAAAGRRHVIPCCYELQSDLARVAATLGLDAERVVTLHTSVDYTVYAIGFCPGFPYLGYLPTELCGVPRLPQPRVRVEPGSVGMTGRQTGIYPLPRPGGWNLIGRTPLVLVDVEDNYFPLRAGDTVRFERIDATQFAKLQGERLGEPET